MRHQRMPEARGKADGGFSGEKLRRHSADQTHKAQKRHDADHAHDMAFVFADDALIDDGGDDERNNQLKRGFKELEQRAEDALTAIAFEIDEELFQTNTTFDRNNPENSLKNSFIIYGRCFFCNAE